MPETVITVENLSKRYVIGHQTVDRERYTALRDVMARNARNLWRKTLDMARGRAIVAGDKTEEFWALKDVSFEVKRGEVLGIIGRNGAGKSTLLKILSRITAPTAGRVHLRGRVASLLEVGTGFHPELTGRENIYLNGAILGMTRAEITRRFDEIVAFAEVERFLDTPVKRYSSGMYVRLAFAVAAHLEQEILVVDEVLAVGDTQFQEKCLGKMDQVARGGRTVLFVSHNIGAVQALSRSGLLFEEGSLRFAGPISDAVRKYAQAGGANETFEHAVGFGAALTLTRLELSPTEIKSGESLSMLVEWTAKVKTIIREFAAIVYASNGARVAVLDLRHEGILDLEVDRKPLRIIVRIPSLPLVEGNYSLGFHVLAGNNRFEQLDMISFSVSPRLRAGPAPYPAQYRGAIDLEFHVERLPGTVRELAL